jgi:hypothetical protein
VSLLGSHVEGGCDEDPPTCLRIGSQRYAASESPRPQCRSASWPAKRVDTADAVGRAGMPDATAARGKQRQRSHEKNARQARKKNRKSKKK